MKKLSEMTVEEVIRFSNVPINKFVESHFNDISEICIYAASIPEKIDKEEVAVVHGCMVFNENESSYYREYICKIGQPNDVLGMVGTKSFIMSSRCISKEDYDKEMIIV